jgi:hypothetical protein
MRSDIQCNKKYKIEICSLYMRTTNYLQRVSISTDNNFYHEIILFFKTETNFFQSYHFIKQFGFYNNLLSLCNCNKFFVTLVNVVRIKLLKPGSNESAECWVLRHPNTIVYFKLKHSWNTHQT